VANDYKILGQLRPATATYEDAYTVPAATQAVISTISVCSVGPAAQYRVAVRKSGETISFKQFIAYDAQIMPGGSFFLTLGVSLGAGDLITVYSNNGNVSFGVFGGEITA